MALNPNSKYSWLVIGVAIGAVVMAVTLAGWTLFFEIVAR